MASNHALTHCHKKNAESYHGSQVFSRAFLNISIWTAGVNITMTISVAQFE